MMKIVGIIQKSRLHTGPAVGSIINNGAGSIPNIMIADTYSHITNVIGFPYPGIYIVLSRDVFTGQVGCGSYVDSGVAGHGCLQTFGILGLQYLVRVLQGSGSPNNIVLRRFYL